MHEEKKDTGMSAQDETCTLEVVTTTSAQTQRLGQHLGTLLQAGDLILLDGQLGAGKTTFTQGLAKGMHVKEVVNSPTFTLLKEYMGSPNTTMKTQPGYPRAAHLPLYHFDLYRLDDPDEIIDLGFEDYFYGSGVCVVEWAGNAEGLWPAERLDVRLTLVDSTKRRLLFVATGTRYCELLRQFQKNTYAITSF